jgi:hypothetical protein
MAPTRFAAALAATALLAGCGLGAPDYPTFGEASYRLEGTAAAPDGGATVSTVIYRDGPKMRVETELPSFGRAAIVFDEATNASYVLNAAPAVQPAATTGAPAAAPAGSPATGVSPPPASVATAPPAVIGVAVRIADADAPQALETAWAALGEQNARYVGKCEVAGVAGHDWSPRENTQGAERTACITDDGIVLRLRENDRVLFEATRVEIGPQAASLFGVPPGYQIIDPEQVVERVGDTMEQLDSVTGAAPTPTPAPPRG